MTITTVRSEEARLNWRDMLDTAHTGGAVVIERYSKPVAVVVNYDAWRNTADELARLRRIIEYDRQFAEMDAGNRVNLEDLDKELAALDARTPQP